MTSQEGLDYAAINDLLESVGGDRAFLAELISDYFDDAASLLDEMQRSLAAGDAEDFRRAAHSLKSNGATFGATRLYGIAGRLEEYGKLAELDRCADLLAEAEAAYWQIKPSLEAVRDEG